MKTSKKIERNLLLLAKEGMCKASEKELIEIAGDADSLSKMLLSLTKDGIIDSGTHRTIDGFIVADIAYTLTEKGEKRLEYLSRSFLFHAAVKIGFSIATLSAAVLGEVYTGFLRGLIERLLGS